MRLSVTLCAALALAACNGQGKKETGGKADGEILPAAVSDAMLPYDTVRSQAPLAPSAEGSDAGKAQDKQDAKSSDEAVADAESETEPAEPVEPAE